MHIQPPFTKRLESRWMAPRRQGAYMVVGDDASSEALLVVAISVNPTHISRMGSLFRIVLNHTSMRSGGI